MFLSTPSFDVAQQTIHYIYPMPIPGTLDTPLFKGKYVTNFLDTLKVFTSSSQVLFDNLPSYILCYCHRRVHDIVEFTPLWTQNDWPTVRAYLIKLYGSEDHKPHVSADNLQKWIKHHSCNETFRSIQDVDQYY